MGLFDFLSGQFIDIIQWLDDSPDTMVQRFERQGNEIKHGAKLVVRESQTAVFINEGALADIFIPGTYTLTTRNLPILATLKGWAHGFESPFKAEVYFVSTRRFTDLKWGTQNPIMLRDPEFGPVRLRAFGTYEIRIIDAAMFLREIVGTDGHFTTDEISNQLKSIIVTRFTDILAESKVAALDLATRYDDFGVLLSDAIRTEFDRYGLELTKFLIGNISFPPEVEAVLDKRSSMGIAGNLQQFTQFQAANAIGEMAKHGGGGGDLASGGMGMGMGMALAGQMANAMNQPSQQQPAAAAAPPPLPGAVAPVFIGLDGQQTGPHDLAALRNLIAGGRVTRATLVWRSTLPAWTPAAQVPDLAPLFDNVPPPLPG